jgi:adenosylcobinamide kinase / adenosylcobinamide-phosphate guanylyltransferase
MGRLIVITGGSRSGKSRFAQEMAQRLGGADVAFIATCQALDEEMAARIAAHQADRPREWRTVEEPMHLADAVANCGAGTALVDCLTLFVTNVLLAHEEDHAAAEAAVCVELGRLVESLRASDITAIVVTNEVGMGLVPEYPLGRAFRDIAGRAGQLLASHADEVYMTVLGLPLRLK